MGEVIEGPFITSVDIPPEKILEGVEKVKSEFEQIIVIGIGPNNEYSLFTSTGSKPEILWALEQTKVLLFDEE